MARASLAHRPHFLRGLSNSGKYTALTDSAVSGTTGSQLNKLPLQDLQLSDSNRHMLDVLINQGVDVRTVLWGGIFHAQQRSNLIQGHVQASAVPNERKSFNVLRSIDAVVAFCSPRLWQQGLTLVVANRLHLCIGGLGELFLDAGLGGFIGGGLFSGADGAVVSAATSTAVVQRS